MKNMIATVHNKMEGGKGNNREKGENDKEIENMHSGE
jgi:hypothetical protein